MKLIDADKLIADIENSWDWLSVNEINASTVLRQTITDIQNEPTVNIVHCHECKHLIVYNCGYACDAGHWGKISKESNCGGMGDFYCAEGEKNEKR